MSRGSGGASGSLKALVCAEVETGSLGGGESVAEGLAKGLANIPAKGWDLVVAQDQRMPLRRPAGERLKKALGRWRRPLGLFWRQILGRETQGLPTEIPPLDPRLEAIGADLVHFLLPQDFARTRAKTVVTVHDLQHEHLPEFFTPEHIAYRRMLYRHIASNCDAIVAISAFTQEDFLSRYPEAKGRTFFVPWPAYAVPTEKNECDPVAGVPKEFILYPAFSYAHKNHKRLAAALSLVEREHGIRIPLVCTGGRSAYWKEITGEIRNLSPQPEVVDLGYVGKDTLESLYRKAKLIVFPSLFEGMGLPLVEAFRFHKKVACSDIPPFREFGGNAPEYFDPWDYRSIADCLLKIWKGGGKEPEIAQSLIPRSSVSSWTECANRYLEIYAKVGAGKK